MKVEVEGTQLWFDVDGPGLVPDGPALRARPTILLVHGGPGSYDHSYLKPAFGTLASEGQVVYLDLRGHGRSSRGDVALWSFERCADDLRGFCDALGIVRPIVIGHSMGGIVAMLYGARHPGHAAGLVLQSTLARFDLRRLVESFRRRAGDEVAALAGRDYGGEPVSEAEWARVFAAFGPEVPGPEELARRRINPELGLHGMELLRRLDALAELARIDRPTLVCTGDLDPVTPPDAAREIAAALRPGVGRVAILEGAGHFPWKDAPDRSWPLLIDFVHEVGCPAPSAGRA